MTHTVKASASSLYEGAALGLSEFKRNGFAFISIGPATKLTVSVGPATTHELTVGKLQA